MIEWLDKDGNSQNLYLMDTIEWLQTARAEKLGGKKYGVKSHCAAPVKLLHTNTCIEESLTPCQDLPMFGIRFGISFSVFGIRNSEVFIFSIFQCRYLSISISHRPPP